MGPDAKLAIIEHMNDDHADACLLYAQHYGKRPDASRAVMKDVSLSTLTLEVDGAMLTVPFSRPASCRNDVRAVLVEMVREARSSLSGG